jgi:hypothetical protein
MSNLHRGRGGDIVNVKLNIKSQISVRALAAVDALINTKTVQKQIVFEISLGLRHPQIMT